MDETERISEQNFEEDMKKIIKASTEGISHGLHNEVN